MYKRQEYGHCHAATSYSVFEPDVIGHDTVRIYGNNGTFGDPCWGTSKKMTVIASYAAKTYVPALSDGTQLLRVTDYNGCEVSTTVTIPSSPSAIDERSVNMQVFPNPAKDQLNLKLDRPFTGVINMKNAMGQQVRSISLNNESFVQVDTNLPAGVYFVELKENGETLIATKKVMVIE